MVVAGLPDCRLYRRIQSKEVQPTPRSQLVGKNPRVGPKKPQRHSTQSKRSGCTRPSWTMRLALVSPTHWDARWSLLFKPTAAGWAVCSLCLDAVVTRLTHSNACRYPGLTAKARLRKGTTLVYEDDDCTTEPPGNPEHAPEVSAVQHDKTPRDDRAPSKHTKSSGSKATTHSKDPQLAGTASGPPATSAVSPSRVPLLRPKPAPATSAFKPFYCGTASIIEE